MKEKRLSEKAQSENKVDLREREREREKKGKRKRKKSLLAGSFSCFKPG